MAKTAEKTNEVAVIQPVELEISKLTLGTLVTNAKELKAAVFEKFEDMTPDTYKGDAESAKQARAYINSNIKKLNDRRLELEREWNEPFAEFKGIVNEIVAFLKDKSAICDVIVKAKENEEKAKRKEFVVGLWNSKNFDLVPVDKVFNQKWLNKTAKEKDISDEMDSIIKKIYADLKIIEHYEDVATLKAHYLISLNLEETLAYGGELKEAREKAEAEAASRAEREHNEKIEEQKREVAMQALEAVRNEGKEDLASAALEVADVPEVKEYVVSVKATDEQLLKMKSALTSLGIEFDVEELEF